MMRFPIAVAVLLMSLCLGGCISTPPVIAARAPCSTLLPDEWRDGTPGASLPLGQTAGEWIAFGDAQTAQLEKANERYRAATGIVERCEARDREATERAGRRRVLGLF